MTYYWWVGSCFLCSQQLNVDWQFSGILEVSAPLMLFLIPLCPLFVVHGSALPSEWISALFSPPFWHLRFFINLLWVNTCTKSVTADMRKRPLLPWALLVFVYCFLLFILLLFQFQAFTILCRFHRYNLQWTNKQNNTRFWSHGDLDANRSGLGREWNALPVPPSSLL